MTPWLLLGCWISQAEHEAFIDADGDGSPSDAFTDGSDCDDQDPAVHPGAHEVCNGIDDDCDGEIDEGHATWRPDNDGDGFGDSDATASCEPVAGWVEDGDDCDDTDASVNPDAEEECNGLDNDCDGEIDDGFELTTWYKDADGDGTGDDSSPLEACAAPEGYVAEGGDCAPEDGAIHPGADELCDGADNDCDGETDEDDAVDASTWYADEDNDGYGDTTSPVSACEAPPGYTADASDCDDTTAAASPGAEEVCADGLDNDCDGTSNDCRWSGEISSDDADDRFSVPSTAIYAGDNLDWAGDLDGDGIEDFVVGAFGTNSGRGAAYVGFGPVSAGVGGADLTLLGTQADGNLGLGVLGPGDLDGDGQDDLVAAASGSGAQTVYLLSGPLKAGTRSLDTSTADAYITCTGCSWFGWELSAGDLDNDGWPDLITSAHGYGDGQGYIVAYAGPLGSSSASLVQIYGEDLDYAGTALDASGDLNGDGADDLLVGASGHASTGAAAVFLGPLSGTLILTDADGTHAGMSAHALAGLGAVIVGDVDHDGQDDVLVGARAEGAGGAAYLLLGPTTTTATLAAAAQATFEGEGYAGETVETAGDFDGDGSLDVAISGAPYDDGAGVAYIAYGPFTGRVDLATAGLRIEGLANSYFGADLAGGVDADGDGLDDLLVGARVGSSGGGGAYLFLGKGI